MNFKITLMIENHKIYNPKLKIFSKLNQNQKYNLPLIKKEGIRKILK